MIKIKHTVFMVAIWIALHSTDALFPGSNYNSKRDELQYPEGFYQSVVDFFKKFKELQEVVENVGTSGISAVKDDLKKENLTLDTLPEGFKENYKNNVTVGDSLLQEEYVVENNKDVGPVVKQEIDIVDPFNSTQQSLDAVNPFSDSSLGHIIQELPVEDSELKEGSQEDASRSLDQQMNPEEQRHNEEQIDTNKQFDMAEPIGIDHLIDHVNHEDDHHPDILHGKPSFENPSVENQEINNQGLDSTNNHPNRESQLNAQPLIEPINQPISAQKIEDAAEEYNNKHFVWKQN